VRADGQDLKCAEVDSPTQPKEGWVGHPATASSKRHERMKVGARFRLVIFGLR
jgi:hypothetical protein